jgi:hypothetical protein
MATVGRDGSGPVHMPGGLAETPGGMVRMAFSGTELVSIARALGHWVYPGRVAFPTGDSGQGARDYCLYCFACVRQ